MNDLSLVNLSRRMQPTSPGLCISGLSYEHRYVEVEEPDVVHTRRNALFYTQPDANSLHV